MLMSHLVKSSFYPVTTNPSETKIYASTVRWNYSLPLIVWPETLINVMAFWESDKLLRRAYHSAWTFFRKMPEGLCAAIIPTSLPHSSLFTSFFTVFSYAERPLMKLLRTSAAKRVATSGICLLGSISRAAREGKGKRCATV